MSKTHTGKVRQEKSGDRIDFYWNDNDVVLGHAYMEVDGDYVFIFSATGAWSGYVLKEIQENLNKLNNALPVLASIQEAAEKWATDNCPACAKYNHIHSHIHHELESAFLAGSRHSISEDLIKSLEEMNPFTHQEESLPFEPTNANEGWKNCIETIRSLIKEQSTLTNKEKEV